MTAPHETLRTIDPGQTMPPETGPHSWRRDMYEAAGHAAAAAVREWKSDDEKAGGAKPVAAGRTASSFWWAAIAVGALILSLFANALIVVGYVKHETGNRPFVNALETLVDVTIEHANYSEEAFDALAKGQQPPPRPDRKSKIRAIEKALRQQ